MESRSWYDSLKQTDEILERVRNEPTAADFMGNSRRERRARAAEEKRRLKKAAKAKAKAAST